MGRAAENGTNVESAWDLGTDNESRVRTLGEEMGVHEEFLCIVRIGMAPYEMHARLDKMAL